MIDKELEAAIDDAIHGVREGRRETAGELVRTRQTLAGTTPFRSHKGVGAAWNFTLGPAFVYEGVSSIDTLNFLPMPVCVFAKYIPEEDLQKIDATRVYGFVFEEGSVVDPAYWWINDENRASVLTCEGVLDDVKDGESVIIDGVRGRVYLSPDAETLANYVKLRALGPPHRDAVFWEAVRRLAVLLIGSKKARKIEPPYPMSDQQRLLDVAKKARRGELISPADHEWMQDLLMEGMPSPDEIVKRFKESQKATKKRKADEGGRSSRDKTAKGRAAKGRGAKGRGAKGRGREKGDATDTKDAAKPEAVDAASTDGDDALAGLTGAALRRALRKAERDKEIEKRRKK